MSKSIAMIVGVVLLLALVLFSTTYTVKYNEVAIRTRFGQTNEESVVRDPGLHFRLPLFADRITTLDTRLQLRDTPLDTVQTSDGQQIVVRAYLMWQVDMQSDEGPLRFFNSYPNGVDEANQWLSDQLRTAVRRGVGRFSFEDLMGSETRLASAEQIIRDDLKSLLNRGINPVSVGISQLVLPPKTTTAVLSRMQATRSFLSEAERYKGDAEAAGILNRANGQAEKIRAFAIRRAEEIRAAGNEDAARYIRAMGEDQELAIFLAWIDTLQSSLSEQTTLVIPTSWAPFHMLRLDTPQDQRGIPQPVAEGSRGIGAPAPASSVPSLGEPKVDAGSRGGAAVTGDNENAQEG